MEILTVFCRAFDAALTGIRSLGVLLTGSAMVVLVTIFAWLVFGRYVLNETPTWVEQLALVLVCYIAFIGAAVGVRDDTHLGVTFLREKLPRRFKLTIQILAEAIMAIFGLVMVIACTRLVIFGWDTLLPMLEVPEGVRTLPAAICGGLIFLFAGTRTISLIHALATGRSDPSTNSQNLPEA